MRSRNWIALLLAGALGGVSCGGDDDNGTTGDATGTAPPTSAAAVASTVVETGTGAESGDAVFTDSFDDDRNGWGEIDDPQYGSTAFADGNFVWDFRGSVAHQIPAVLGDQYDRGELDMLNVVVRSEATLLAGGGVIGVFCRETPDTDAEWQWYEFVVRDGFAAIRKADIEANIETLAETDDVSFPIGEPIAIEATCVDDASGDAQLSLALNGTALLQATDDDPLGNGVSGLQAWTFPVHEPMDIRWHELSIARVEP